MTATARVGLLELGLGTCLTDEQRERYVAFMDAVEREGRILEGDTWRPCSHAYAERQRSEVSQKRHERYLRSKARNGS